MIPHVLFFALCRCTIIIRDPSGFARAQAFSLPPILVVVPNNLSDLQTEIIPFNSKLVALLKRHLTFRASGVVIQSNEQTIFVFGRWQTHGTAGCGRACHGGRCR
jgi:hypothetical protein